MVFHAQGVVEFPTAELAAFIKNRITVEEGVSFSIAAPHVQMTPPGADFWQIRSDITTIQTEAILDRTAFAQWVFETHLPRPKAQPAELITVIGVPAIGSEVTRVHWRMSSTGDPREARRAPVSIRNGTLI